MSIFSTVVPWLTRHKERIAILGIGILADRIICYTFDFVLYPYVIWRAGLLWGGVVMALLSLIVCILTMQFYDWSKKDWLGIETIKELKVYAGESRVRRFLAWMLCRSEPVACLALSVTTDPFVTTVYLRQGKFTGMGRRDWTIFMASWLIGNIYWALACYMGISLVEWVWQAVRGAA
ncbi:MAG: hypothetical protein WC256_04310 [Desulfurivibrionaceae bacterium]|jgi:hypothetical protein